MKKRRLLSLFLSLSLLVPLLGTTSARAYEDFDLEKWDSENDDSEG